MKIRIGILLAGVSAIALAGCNTTSNGFNGNATAFLGSGVVTSGNVTSTSTAATDPKTAASISFNTQGTTVGTDDTATVSVQNGGAVTGPTNYVFDNTIGTAGIVASNNGYTFEGFKPATADPTSNSILVAGVGKSFGASYAGFVGSNSVSTGAGNIAAGFGGVGPSGQMPSGSVTYTGAAAASVATTGSSANNIIGGNSSVAANFTTGAVTGTLDFTGTANDVAFTGAMDTAKAGYTASTVTLGGAAATGQLQGGFDGTGYTETSGAFDVQAGTTKEVGAFGGSR